MKYLFATDRAIQALHRIAATSVVIYYLVCKIWEQRAEAKRRH